MGHVARGLIVAGDLDSLRVAEVARGEALDLLAHGGGEQQDLTVGLGLVEDAAHHRQEAHVGHPVGLVDHDEAHLGEVHHPLLDQVLEPARACDQDVHALVEGSLGRPVAGAAVDGDDATGASLHDRAELVSHLGGELTGGLEDEAPRATGRRVPGGLDGGDPEGEGLARAGRGLGHDVTPLERGGDGGRLHRERRGDASRLEAGADARVDAKIGKCCGHLYSYCMHGPTSCTEQK